MNILQKSACTLALVLSSLPAHATDAGSHMMDKPAGNCVLGEAAVHQTIKLVFDNVTHATDASLDELAKHVSPDVVFTDPTATTRGREAFRKVYAQFITTDPITYKILDWSCSGRSIYVNWTYGMKGKLTHDAYVEWEGMTKLVVGKDNLISEEVDNWAAVPADFVPMLRK